MNFWRKAILLPAFFENFSAKSQTSVRVVFWLGLLLFFFSASLAVPAQFTTATADGAIGTNEYGTHTDFQNQGEINDGVRWFMTWDNTNLYVAVTGTSNNNPMVLYIDADNLAPINGGTNAQGTLVGFNYDGTSFDELPFRAEFVSYIKSGYREYRRTNGSNGWGNSVSNASYGTYGEHNGNQVREIAIPWSAVTGGGRPTGFNFFGYITSGSNNTFGAVPKSNGIGSPGGANMRFSRYFTVTATANGSSVKPFSRDSYVFNSTSDISGFGSISIYDFTINTAGRTLTRGSGVWTVGGTLRVSSGTLSFGSTSDAANVTGSVVIESGGTLTLSNSGGGDLSLGGDWTRNGTFNPNNRAVTFNGTGAQSLGGSGMTDFSYLTVNKASGVLTLTQNARATVTASNALNLTNGLVDAGSNTLSVTHTAADALSGGGSAAYVIGNLARGLANGGGTYVFPVGRGSSYAPVTLSNVSNVGSGLFVASTFNTAQSDLASMFPQRLNRYWTTTNNPDAAATILFQYLAGDITVTSGAPESFYSVFSVNAGTPTKYNTTVINAAADTATITADNTIDPRATPIRLGPTAPTAGTKDWSTAFDSPTAAKLAQADGYHTSRGNLLRWHSAFEEGNLGFRVYREEGRQRVPVTPELIAGSALKYGAGVRLSAGASYSWWDEGGAADGVYWIEDIALDGKREWHGPIATKPSDDKGLDQIAASPFLSSLVPSANGTAANGLVRGYATDLANSPLIASDAGLRPETEAGQRQLRLAAGAAVKIGVTQTGWHRVTAAQLMAAGLSLEADARYLQLYADGVQIPVALTTTGGGLGLGSAGTLEFYGVALDTPEADTRTYWLVRGDTFGLRYGPPVRGVPGWNQDGEHGATPAVAESKNNAEANAPAPPPSAATSFAYTVERKDRAFYIPSIHNGARENMFGFVVTPTPRDIPLRLNRLQANAGTPATVEVTLQGATPEPHSVRFALNGQEIGTADFIGNQYHKARFTVAPSVVVEGDNTLTLTSLNGSGDVSVTDYVRVTYAHRYEAENNQLLFATGNRNRLTVNGFTSANVRVFDVTDNNRPFAVAGRVEADASGYAVTLNGALRGRTLLAVGADQILTPAQVSANTPSTWTNSSRVADLVILTHASFRSAVEPLANLRRGQGLRTEVIDVEDIYDEWAAGAHDTAAVTGFLGWAAQNWATAPRYVLLMGDASLDPRNYLGFGVRDYVPTVTVDTSQLETASDEALVDFDSDGIGELSIGRLPARTPAQAEVMVQKIVNYQPTNQVRALLVSDRLDGYNFGAANQVIAGMLPANTNPTIINREGQSDSTVRQQVLAGLNSGPTIVNYMGHASVETWMSASILQASDASTLTNGRQLPVIVMMSCLNGYFQDIYSESLSEALMNATDGGAVAVWSSSALTYASQQISMNRSWFQQAFPASGPTPRLGDLTRVAKQGTNSLEVRRSWILFGDPTMQIR